MLVSSIKWNAYALSSIYIFNDMFWNEMSVMPAFELMPAVEPMTGNLICAHRIEARVARSRGDSARFFQKSGRSTRSLLGITQGLESTLPGGRGKV